MSKFPEPFLMKTAEKFMESDRSPEQPKWSIVSLRMPCLLPHWWQWSSYGLRGCEPGKCMMHTERSRTEVESLLLHFHRLPHNHFLHILNKYIYIFFHKHSISSLPCLNTILIALCKATYRQTFQNLMCIHHLGALLTCWLWFHPSRHGLSLHF